MQSCETIKTCLVYKSKGLCKKLTGNIVEEVNCIREFFKNPTILKQDCTDHFKNF